MCAQQKVLWPWPQVETSNGDPVHKESKVLINLLKTQVSSISSKGKSTLLLSPQRCQSYELELKSLIRPI